MKFTQMQRSILAIILCIVFLWTGKKFIWNQDAPMTTLPDDPTDSVAEIQPEDTTPIATDSQTNQGSSTTTSTETTRGWSKLEHTSTTGGSDGSSASSTTSTVSSGVVTYTQASGSESGSSISAPTDTAQPVTTTTTTETSNLISTPPATPPADGLTVAPDGYFDDALFIGDSRTVGIASYGPIEGATYFATVGLSTYKMDKSNSEVAGTKGQNFETVLNAKQYGKVYVMLGINELGYDRNVTKNNFSKLIDRIRAAQPNAIIYVEGNLHVTAARGQKDQYVNNREINSYNTWLASLADNETIYYLDINPVFDDAEGNLNPEYTKDGVHPFAKYYISWSEWISQHVIVK